MLKSSKLVTYLSLWACLSASLVGNGKPNPQDPIWEEFIVGDVKDIPNESIRSFIYDSQHNNPYAAYIEQEMKIMGPFAPEQSRVFWLPTLEVPLVEREWRFVSRLEDAPKYLKNLALVTKNGQPHIRMLLHPYSTQEKVFQDMAQKYGGFKYDFQAATTASVRSLIIWKTSKSKQAGSANQIDFPNQLGKVFHGKVSLYGVDINGSRLNPAKKMARAETVTRLMNDIPKETKQRVGFDFSGEWIIGVPDGTDAGFVYRELLAPYTGEADRKVIPGYAVLRPESLNKLTSRVKNPLDKIMEKVFKPVAKTTAYLLFEEMMLGEMHSQNYGFVADSSGKLTGEVVLHDADAFRVSLQGRVLNDKTVGATRALDHPFFYLKDSVFAATQSSSQEVMTLNSLMDYLLDPNDPTSMPGTVWEWCATLTPKPTWCTGKRLRQRFLGEMAKYISPYVGRDVKVSDLEFTGENRGSVGIIALFKERLNFLSRKFSVIEENSNQKELIQKKFEQLVAEGRGRTYGTLNPSRHLYRVVQTDADTLIMVHDQRRPDIVRGIAVLGLEADGGNQKFLNALGLSSTCGSMKQNSLGSGSTFKSLPLMRRMGGGNNVGWIDRLSEQIFAFSQFTKEIFWAGTVEAQ